ncbi:MULTISPECIES: VOC family protein [Streptomyces]|uniref:VOC family protein n=1 Tax=Streptomyces TaxID=1883 RepID=UPI0004ABAE42|nr:MULTISPECIES: VOC family protein [Streptomyces]
MSDVTTTPLATLAAISLDTPDPKTLAAFYQQALGWEEIWADDNVVYLSGGGVRLGFQKVAEYKRPEWPTQDVPQQFHLDLSVSDVPTAEARFIELGATLAAEQPGGDRWRVLLDLDGHPFCITALV